MTPAKSNYEEVIKTKLEYIQRDISEIKQTLNMEYVSKQEFDPVKKLVYGMVSIILVSVVGALITLVIRK